MNERYYTYKVDFYDRGNGWLAKLMYGPMVINVKTATSQARAERRGAQMAKRANRRLSNERKKR